MNPQADIVKKGLLKFKVAKSKGASRSGIDGPKGFKEFWFVFRALESGDKLLEYYQNERKYHDKGPSKGWIPLREANFVQHHDLEKKHLFCIEFREQSVAFFEAMSTDESEDWMQCLNAVLFGKGPRGDGILQYDVELYENPLVRYSGPCILEVKDDMITIWNPDTWEDVVSWNLAHIRSFKAKKHMLTIYPGNRSSTGRGEFFFKSTQSVQITHAIETIVQRVKAQENRRSQTVPIGRHLPTSVSAPSLSRSRATAPSEGRPLPALPLGPRPYPHTSMHPSRSTSTTPSTPGSVTLSPPPADLVNIPDHIVPEHWFFSRSRKLSTDAVSKIPDYKAPEYEELDTVQEAVANALGPIPPPPQLSRQAVPDVGVEEYGHLEHVHTTPQAISSHEAVSQQLSAPAQADSYSRIERKSHSPRASPKPSRPRRGDYEDIPDGPSKGYGTAQADSFSRIERKSHSPRASPKPSRPRRGDYEDIPDGPSEGYGKLDHRFSAHLPIVDGEYDFLNNPPSPVPANKKSSSPVLAKKPSPPVLAKKSSSPVLAKKKPPPPKPAPYKPKPLSPSTSVDVVEDVYSEIDQDKPVNVQVGTAEEYNKLDRKDARTTFKGRPTVPVPTPEGYGKLNRPASTSNPELTASGEHYGALEHFPRSRTPGNTRSVYVPEEYGKLDHGHSGFDPYASLSLSESYRDGPGRLPGAANLKQETDYADEPQLTSEEFYGQLNTEQGPVDSSDYSTVELPNPPAVASNGNRLLSPQSSLSGIEEVLDNAPNPPKNKFEVLYQPSRDDIPVPPLPPRRGASVRNSPQIERKNGITVTPPNGSPLAPRTTKAPVVPPKPKPKPKKPRVHIL